MSNSQLNALQSEIKSVTEVTLNLLMSLDTLAASLLGSAFAGKGDIRVGKRLSEPVRIFNAALSFK